MSLDGRSIFALVPARGGSKGIPRKNLARVAGRSLIERVADVVAALPWLDAAVLSTDDEEIAEAGRRAGLDVPFMRPDSLATDRAGSVEMWTHAWESCEAHYGRRFELSVLLEPTSPLRRPEDVDGALRRLLESGAGSVVTVSRNPAHFTPERTLMVEEDGGLRSYLEEGLRHTSRQTIPAYFHRNGVAYAMTRECLMDRGVIIGNDCAAHVIERDLVNIDEPIDLEWAEFVLRREGAAGGG